MGVLFPGGCLGERVEDGNRSLSGQTSYRGAYSRGHPESVLVASRRYGAAEDGQPWLPPVGGATHSRCIEHDSAADWASGLQTTYRAVIPGERKIRQTLHRSLQQAADSREMSRHMGALGVEDTERRWRRWSARRERAELADGVGSMASASDASTMPAGGARPKPREDCFTRFVHGKPLLSETEAAFQRARGARGPCGEPVSLAAPHSDRKHFSVLLPTIETEEPPDEHADPKWQGPFRSLMVARKPRITAIPKEALSRRGEDLG